eukprot:2235129-Rhodomonas_salina.10
MILISCAKLAIAQLSLKNLSLFGGYSSSRPQSLGALSRSVQIQADVLRSRFWSNWIVTLKRLWSLRNPP